MNFKNIAVELKENAKLVRKKGSNLFTLKKEFHQIDEKHISPNAIKVIKKLVDAGYKAYLVGGCIRDLLLNKKPKDFDVCTNATPQQIIRVCNNGNIIGRRFKIVHVRFNEEIIEVTTFRRNTKSTAKHERKQANDGLIVLDNAYGNNLQEDSERRDFSINALYYDIKSKQILDYHAGIYDLMQKRIEMIGDPTIRYSEDPVRMIRACRFAAKLNFKLSQRTLKPIAKSIPLLQNVSNARMFEEINKLFLTGHGCESFKKALELQLLPALFPQLESLLQNNIYQQFISNALSSSDNRSKENKPNRTNFLYAIMLWGAFCKKVQNSKYQSIISNIDSNPDAKKIIDGLSKEIIREQNKICYIPEMVAEEIYSIWFNQLLMGAIANNEKLLEEFYQRRNFRACYDFLILRSKLEPLMGYLVKIYAPYYEKSLVLRTSKVKDNEKNYKNRKNRRKAKLQKRIKQDLEKYIKISSNDFSAKDRGEILKKAQNWRKEMGLK